MLSPFTKNNPIRIIAILSLIFVLAISIAWAHDNDGNDASQGTYNVSEIIEFGCGTTIDVVDQGNKVVKIWVDSEALDDYMIEQGINEVNLTVEVIETLIQPPDGNSYYQLDFIFGPAGAFFTPEWEVRIEGEDYVSASVWMYDEDGEALETYEHNSDEKLYFLVPHFSSYYYEGYDY